MIWLGAMLVGIGKVIVWNRYGADNLNYYCLPFQMMKMTNPVIVGIQSAMILVTLGLIASYIVIQVLLFAYLRQHMAKTSKIFRSKIQAHKFAIRMSCLITSNILTWLPILITQLFIMYGDDVSPSTFLMVVMTSLPANLLIDPAILASPFMKI